jgi:hypothetical protein
MALRQPSRGADLLARSDALLAALEELNLAEVVYAPAALARSADRLFAEVGAERTGAAVQQLLDRVFEVQEAILSRVRATHRHRLAPELSDQPVASTRPVGSGRRDP